MHLISSLLPKAWIDKYSADFFSLPGYLLFSFPRLSKKGGGIMIFVKSCYVCSVCDVDVNVSCFEFGVIQAVNVLTGEHFTLCEIYKPPNTNISEFVDEFGTFCEFFLDDKSFKGTSLILGGDFNVNLLRFGSNNIVSKFVDTVYASCLLLSIFLLTRVTKHSSTLIDNIFVNHSS